MLVAAGTVIMLTKRTLCHAATALVEGAYPGCDPDDCGGDRHVLALDNATCTLYELYNAARWGNGWRADSGAKFDLISNKYVAAARCLSCQSVCGAKYRTRSHCVLKHVRRKYSCCTADVAWCYLNKVETAHFVPAACITTTTTLQLWVAH